jgi:hypothetical protein
LQIVQCSFTVALLLLAGVFDSANVSAQPRRFGSPEWIEHCKRWIDQKAYAVDYIEEKTGKRQPSFSVEWKGNVKREEARVSDVAIVLRKMDDGRQVGYVGYIEKIEPAA